MKYLNTSVLDSEKQEYEENNDWVLRYISHYIS